MIAPRRLLCSLLLCSLLFAAIPGTTVAGELVYVALGAQTAVGMQAGDPSRIAEVLGRSGRRVRLVDLTAPGVTVAELRRDHLSRAVALRPFLVTVAIGPADACGHTSLSGFSRDLQTVADLLHRNAPNVIVSTFARPAEGCALGGRALERRVDAFQWAIIRAVRRNRLSLVDLGGGLASPHAWREVIEGKVALLSPRVSLAPVRSRASRRSRSRRS